ncbi:MAG: hypothetical protein ACLGI3_16620, partial [Actinomycetes bacterium]
DLDVADDGTAWAIFVDGLCDPEDPEAGCGGSEAAVVHLHPSKPLIGPIPEPAPPVVAAPAPPAPAAPARRCLRGRRLVVRVKKPHRGKVRSFRVTANGRRLRVRRGRAVINLRQFRGKTLVVRTLTRTRARRSFRTHRRYRVC